MTNLPRTGTGNMADTNNMTKNMTNRGATVPSADFLSEKYTIDTPENVTFGYEVAGIGSRFIGALIDSLVLIVALIVLNIALITVLATIQPAGAEDIFGGDEDISWFAGLLLAIYTVINFVIIWGYYIIFELVWNGQTPGKRVANARVVRADGNPAGLMAIVVRNLVRIIDFLPTGYGIGLITMFCNAQARRLGDFAAGTMVIKTGGAINLDSFAQQPTASGGMTSTSRTLSAPARAGDPLWQRFPAIGQLVVTDYELISETLVRHRQWNVDEYTVRRLACAVARKMGMAEPTRQESYDFLKAVAEAYRRFGG